VKILLAIHETPSSEDAIREVEERFRTPDTTVRVLHVVAKFVPLAAALWDAGGNPEIARAKVVDRFRALVERTAERLKARGLAAEAIVKDGNPGKVIVSEAKVWRADLIVTGAPSHSRLQRMVTGNITQYVFNHASCSVEVVHGKESKSNG
jgi:nucleotide-binding universal stress UspA family protein